MKYMGEDKMSTEGATLSGAFFLKAETVYGHSSGESLRWAPKVHGQEVLISQAKGQSDNDVKREGSLSFLRQSISVSKCSGFFIYLQLRDHFI